MYLPGTEGRTWERGKQWSERRISKPSRHRCYVTHNACAAGLVYHWLTFLVLLQGPPGNPGYQGQAGTPVSVSS